MNYRQFFNQVTRQVAITKRLSSVAVIYIIFLMSPVRKHTFEAAATFANSTKSRFSKFLKKHKFLAIYTLNDLSKKQAKQFSGIIEKLKDLPWKVAIMIDATLQNRSSRHPENSQRFNHGQGFVIGHQWTNIVLFFNGLIIPLAPIPFYSKNLCKLEGIAYRTANEALAEYITGLKLAEIIGDHSPKDIVVLADSGYDDKKIENMILNKGWDFIIALKCSRGVKSVFEYKNTPKSRGWADIATFFQRQRRLKWKTIRIFITKSSKRKRMDFRVRQTAGYLKNVGKVRLVCSELKKRPDGRRKFLACSNLEVTARMIIIGYRLRWKIEIFHKEVKMFLGFEDVSAISFDAVTAHVHWVYCAYILLNSQLPGIPAEMKSLAEKQKRVHAIVESKEKSRVMQLLTQFKGLNRYKSELRQALTAI
jgi:hypothetical protein